MALDWHGIHGVFIVLEGPDGNPVKMKQNAGLMQISKVEPVPVSLADVGATAVSFTTPLTNWLDVGEQHSTLLFACGNTGTDTGTMTVQTSEDGVKPDVRAVASVDVTTGNQGSVEVGPNASRRYYRVVAVTANPGVTNATMTCKVKGIPRNVTAG